MYRGLHTYSRGCITPLYIIVSINVNKLGDVSVTSAIATLRKTKHTATILLYHVYPAKTNNGTCVQNYLDMLLLAFVRRIHNNIYILFERNQSDANKI